MNSSTNWTNLIEAMRKGNSVNETDAQEVAASVRTDPGIMDWVTISSLVFSLVAIIGSLFCGGQYVFFS